MDSVTLRRVAIGCAAVATAAIVLAAVYFAVPSGSLPSILGPVRAGQGHHERRAVAALLAGLLLAGGAVFAFRTLDKRRRRGSYM